MVNKKIKKKTKWHPLSLAGQDDEKQVDDPNKSRVPFKMEWKISHNATDGTTPHFRNNNSNNNTTSLHHHNNHRFDKRASSNKSYSKSHHNGYSSTNTTGATSFNKFGKHEHQHSHKDFPKKVQFNEDEYTRITTPRQDVLFKKGYLSRPKTQPVTPTHQPLNNVPVDGFYPSYITADSPPLAINGGLTSPNGAEYPFIPAGHGAFMNDALNNVYGSPVFFMPYPDVYYPPTTSDLEIGDQYSLYNNNQYSPPLIEENDGSVSQPVTSTTSTNCSDGSESSEEVTTTTTETATPTKEPIEETQESSIVVPEQDSIKVDPEITEADVQVTPECYENGYESINPYLNPYAPVYYYPMPFYPVPAIGPYSPTTEYYPEQETLYPVQNGFEHARHNKYPKRKKRYRKTLSSSGTSITDYSEDESMSHHENTGSGDSGFTETTSKAANIEDTRPVAPHTPESINENIAHQSTLNVEVPEFRPKTNGFVNNNNKKKTNNEKKPVIDELSHEKKQIKSNNRKPLTDKKLQTRPVPVVNGDNNNQVNNSSNTNTNKNNTSSNKKRTTNPALDKKFLIESIKNLEMSNIDLMKTKSETLSRVKEDVKVETTWVIIGGKRKMIQEEIVSHEKETKDVENEILVENGTEPPVTDTVTSVTTNNAQQIKKTSRKCKQKNKIQNKRNVVQGKNTKLQGFVIEEPTFETAPVETEAVTVNESDIQEEIEAVESDTEELQEAALIEEIPWTDADVTYEPEPAASLVVNNTNETENNEPCDETKIEIEQELDQNKAEELHEADVTCSNQINLVEEESHTDVFETSVDDVIEVVEEKIEEIHVKVVEGGKNGLTKHKNVQEIVSQNEESNSKTNIEETPIEVVDESEAAILEINENKYFLTAAVCNWLKKFDHNDLQSLFTIPLSADFVTKIKYCSEISKYFADDELQNLDKFINENFCKYQQLSASSSLSSLLSDSDSDEDDTESTSTRSTKKALKVFGCEIM